MDRLELIDKAINEANGLWCGEHTLLFVSGELNVLYPKHTKFIYDRKATESNGYWDLVCTVDEYLQRAKELGWINGYKWGVEYPTNGKKPDLPDDVKICIQNDTGLSYIQLIGFVAHWCETQKFRIVDNRYKPVSETPEKQQNVSYFPDNKQNTGNVSTDNSWYENGELPPTGVECEWSTNGGRNWYKTKIIFSDKTVVLTTSYQLYKIDDPDVLFRPLKSERERFVEAAWLLTENELNFGSIFRKMFDAGFRAPE